MKIKLRIFKVNLHAPLGAQQGIKISRRIFKVILIIVLVRVRRARDQIIFLLY